MTADGTSMLIGGARIFDGDRLRSASSVLLASRTIAGMGVGLNVPEGDLSPPGHWFWQ